MILDKFGHQATNLSETRKVTYAEKGESIAKATHACADHDPRVEEAKAGIENIKEEAPALRKVAARILAQATHATTRNPEGGPSRRCSRGERQYTAHLTPGSAAHPTQGTPRAKQRLRVRRAAVEPFPRAVLRVSSADLIDARVPNTVT